MIENLVKNKVAYLHSKQVKGKYSTFDPKKEKEIIVWIRLQKGLDKPETVDFIKKKFNVDDNHAETLFYKALPDGLSREEFEKVDDLSLQLQSLQLQPVEVNNFLDSHITPETEALPVVDVLSLMLESLGNLTQM